MTKLTEPTMPPMLDQEYSLPDDAATQYERDGHILLRGVAAQDEAEEYYGVLHDLVQRHNTNTTPLEERDTYGKAFIQIGNLWQKDERARRFVLARRFAKIAADLMGVDGVRLYHDQALWKEPGGGHTPWHQDQFYWPLETDKTITMWMPLVDTTADMGTMTFVSGTQRLGYLGDIPISDSSEEYFENFIRERDLRAVNCGAMQAGDATFHSGWTLHGAPANQTQNTRAVMTIIYFADGARVTQPKHANQEADLKAFFPNLQPGDIAASPLNPLVYRRSE
jgi:ectoine hydroxylase-related dioxygenase (phytanoyl-CoA dioxygenase family)